MDAGGARHVFYLTMQQQSRLVRLNWMSQPFGVMAIGIAKASVALSILRFQAPNKWRTRLLYFIALSINVLDLLVCIFMFVQCSPARALWSPELATTARCWNPKIFEYYSIFVSSMSRPVYISVQLQTLTYDYRLWRRLGFCSCFHFNYHHLEPEA